MIDPASSDDAVREPRFANISIEVFRRRWNDYFFAPQSATDLAACRVLVYGLLLVYYLQIPYAPWADVTRAAWFGITPFTLTGVRPLPHGWLLALEWTWKLSLLTACLGFVTRLSTVVAFLAGIYLLGLPHNFGKVNHYDALAVFVLLVMTVARCGDSLSLDALLRRRRRAGAGGAVLPPSGEYRWPIRCVWIVFAVVFFSAGYSKLYGTGLTWVTSDQMSTVLLKDQYNGSPPVRWGAWIARQPVLPHLMAASTLILELGYPLALFSRRLRLLFVPGMFFAQLGIRLLMGPAFWPFLICSVFWVPWSYVWPFSRLETTVERNSPSLRPRSAQL